MDSKLLANEICKLLSDKKGSKIITLNVADMTSVTEYFVICSGTSSAQVRGLFDNLEEQLEKQGIRAKRFDGAQNSKWIAVDYGDVIVHIFHEETRQFYQLDRLWNKGDNLTEYVD